MNEFAASEIVAIEITIKPAQSANILLFGFPKIYFG